MKTQYKLALGLVVFSWLATGAVWLKQKNDLQQAERTGLQSMRNMQDANQSQWGGGMRQRWIQVPEAKKKIITASITEQLKAFKQNDYNKAAEFQSSALRRNFSSTAMFRAIIRRSYPEFANYKSVSFGRARMDPDQKRVAILTLVTGSSGKTSRVMYFMVNENNQYRVDGVARARDRGRFIPPAPPSQGPKTQAPDGLPPSISPQQPLGSVPPGMPPRADQNFAPPGAPPPGAPPPGAPPPGALPPGAGIPEPPPNPAPNPEVQSA